METVADCADDRRPEPNAIKVPLALSPEGTLVEPTAATRGVRYACPGCLSEVRLRAGAIVRHHFAHLPSLVCSGETVLHKTAKLLIQSAVTAAIRREAPISLELACGHCRHPFQVPFPVDRVGRAEVEWRDVTGRVIDVMLLEGDEARLGVEILVSHAVDEEKASDLAFPWVELDARHVLQNATVWRPLQYALKTRICKPCRALERAIKSVQAEFRAELKRKWRIDEPAGYSMELARCWKCSELLPMFHWGDGAWDRREPPSPRPATVQWRYSKTIGDNYWANTCPKCKSLQGDFFAGRAAAEFYSEVYNIAMRRIGELAKHFEQPRRADVRTLAR